jgi:polysaccharide biosynthesis transport protein
MEKPYSRLSNSEGNSQSVEKLLHYQSLPLTSEQSDDKDSDEFFGILRRRGIIIAGVVTTMMLAVGSLTLSQKPDYEGNFRLLVEPVTNDESVPDVASNNNPNNPKPTLDYETQIQVLKSPELIADVAKELQASYSGITRDSLAKSLRITRLAETKVIDVRYQSNNPEKIKTVLDKLANYYLKYSLEKQQTKLRQGKQFVDEQLPPLRQRVEGLQKELQDFRRAYQFTNPDTQREDIAIETRLLNEQRLKIDQQLSLARANFLNMQQRRTANAILNESLTYQDLVKQVRQLDAQIAQELTRFQEGSPAVENLRERREILN